MMQFSNKKKYIESAIGNFSWYPINFQVLPLRQNWHQPPYHKATMRFYHFRNGRQYVEAWIHFSTSRRDCDRSARIDFNYYNKTVVYKVTQIILPARAKRRPCSHLFWQLCGGPAIELCLACRSRAAPRRLYRVLVALPLPEEWIRPK